MLEELKRIEREELRSLLETPSIWNSLNVDYHPPFVERVWTQIGDNRLSLHVIHPCQPGEALWHPHEWQTAFHVLPVEGAGVYEQGIGHGVSNEPMFGNKFIYMPLMKMEVHGEMYYEMTHENCAHYVRPIDKPVYTLMLSSPVKWPDNKREEIIGKKLEPLHGDRVQEIFSIFKLYYGESR